MRIVSSERVRVIEVSLIDAGENFVWLDEIFIKIDSHMGYLKSDGVYAVSLSDGIIRKFKPDTAVKPIDAELFVYTLEGENEQ